jgi:recombination protein RecT
MPELKADETPAQVAKSSQKTIEDWLEDPVFQNSLQKILPKHLTSERFAAVAMRQFRLVPGLRKCTPESVLGGFMDAAALGLEIGINGEAYLIPYNQTVKDANGDPYKVDLAQLQIGYLGQMKLGWNSGKVSSIEADVVTYDEVEAGRFDYQRGTEGFLRHKPMADRDLSEKNIAFAWALIWIKGSDRPIWRVLDHKEIQRLRNTGRSANSPAWKNHYAEMSIGKALKRVFKWAPKSREQGHAIALDDQADAGLDQDFDAARDVSGILPASVPTSAAQNMMDESGAASAEAPGAETMEMPSMEREKVEAKKPEPEPEDKAAAEPKPQGAKKKLGW